MTAHGRPSLDVLVPLVMIDDQPTEENDDGDVTDEPQKEILRHFESGDIVIVRLNSQCLPAIVFSITGLVMKFDIDRQLYHVCLLNKEFTEQWVDAADMITYSVPMIAECENEEVMLMWSVANELLDIPNDVGDKIRLEEFKRRFSEARQQQVPLLSTNTSRKSRKTHSSTPKTSTVPQILYAPLTACEALHIIDSIYRSSHCTFADAKRTAEDTYAKIICTNNRENNPSYSTATVPQQWFLTFVIGHGQYFRQYSASWLSDLEAMVDKTNDADELRSLISLMKETV